MLCFSGSVLVFRNQGLLPVLVIDLGLLCLLCFRSRKLTFLIVSILLITFPCMILSCTGWFHTMWRHPSSVSANIKSVWKKRVHIIVDLLVLDRMRSKRSEARGAKLFTSNFLIMILYNINASWFIYLFQLAKPCKILAVVYYYQFFWSYVKR